MFWNIILAVFFATYIAPILLAIFAAIFFFLLVWILHHRRSFLKVFSASLIVAFIATALSSRAPAATSLPAATANIFFNVLAIIGLIALLLCGFLLLQFHNLRKFFQLKNYRKSIEIDFAQSFPYYFILTSGIIIISLLIFLTVLL